ncbi:MAG TPA: SGNH/GDSL hydrolase family protein [Nannocystis sp.]|jgi:lysophospholipase L1-like esterase
MRGAGASVLGRVLGLHVLLVPACADVGTASTSETSATSSSSGTTSPTSGGDEAATTGTADTTGEGGSTSSGSTGAEDGTTGGSSSGEPPPAAVTVSVLGASTAVGWNLDKPEYGGEVGGLKYSWVNRYEAYLQVERPGSQVYNLSKAGYGTYEALPTGTVNPADRPQVDPVRNITAALARDPDVIIVHYPSGGDLDNGILVKEIIDNLEVIAATAAAANVPIWVATPNPLSKTPQAKIDQFLDMRAQILTIYGDRALDFWALRVGPDGNALPEYTLLDGHHPNAEGHRLLFELVVAVKVVAPV